MAAPLKMSVEDARAALDSLRAATEAVDLNVLAPIDWIKRFHEAVRAVAPREEHYRYRVDGFHGTTMGRLHRRVCSLLGDFDGLVEDNPRLTRKE